MGVISFVFNRLVWHFKNTNFLKTVVVNFRFLPLRQAVKFPIHVMGRLNMCFGSNGSLIFNGDKIKPFSLHIGDCNLNFCHKSSCTSIRIFGELLIEDGVDIQRGANITVTPSGKLVLSEKVQICSNTKIVCANSIKIGENSQISHESQIFDTNFHPVIDMSSGEVSFSSPIEIGDYCWIGNRTTINMGSILSSNTIVASNSLLNKDYSNLGANCTLGGIPARLISNSKTRIWNSLDADEFINNKIILV